MNAIKINEEYKNKKKLEAIEIKKIKKMKMTRENRTKYREKLCTEKQQNTKAYYESKKQKDIAKRIKEHERKAEIKKRELL